MKKDNNSNENEINQSFYSMPEMPWFCSPSMLYPVITSTIILKLVSLRSDSYPSLRENILLSSLGGIFFWSDRLSNNLEKDKKIVLRNRIFSYTKLSGEYFNGVNGPNLWGISSTPTLITAFACGYSLLFKNSRAFGVSIIAHEFFYKKRFSYEYVINFPQDIKPEKLCIFSSMGGPNGNIKPDEPKKAYSVGNHPIYFEKYKLK
jgi:hypothetical protein